MTDIKLPASVVKAAAMVLHANNELFHDILWDDLGDGDQDAYREEATAALLAGLKAWPGAEHVFRQPHRRAVDYSKPAIILPLTEKHDD